MSDLISVVIPVYNVEKYLDRCVQSIVNQTYSNLEIILVDDGSTDGSPAICDKWAEKDNRIKTLHKTNAGAGLARNTGIDNASGQYILFVDSDDYIDAETAEKCLTAAQKNNADIVMFGRNDVFKDGTVKPKKVCTDITDFENDLVINDILPGLFTYDRGFGVGVWGKLFRLDIIKENNIRFESERKVISEDAYFLLCLFKYIKKIKILRENLYFYFKNENSFSRKYKKGYQSLNDCFLQQSKDLCESQAYPEKILRYVTARYHTYSLVGMKQIIASDLPGDDKQRELKAVFGNSVLHSTLSDDVLTLAIPQSKIFWRLFRAKMFAICYLLLWYKAKQQ